MEKIKILEINQASETTRLKIKEHLKKQEERLKKIQDDFKDGKLNDILKKVKDDL